MIYNFRFDRGSVDEILTRLRDEEQLSQGWGGGMDCGLPITDDDFVRRTFEHYELATTRIPSNLLRIRDFAAGDLLVTPHLPEYGKVSVHVVDADFPKCYEYVAGDPRHQNHRIKIRRSYGLNGSISIHNARLAAWRGKLQWMRLPILPMQELGEPFRQLIRDIDVKPDLIFEASDLDQYLDDVRACLFERCKDRLSNIAASGRGISFEAVCERLVFSAGYSIEARHHFDRKGGDADLVCSRQRSDASPFEIGTSTLLVQIKKHSGTSDEHAVAQLLGMLAEFPDADAVVMSLADNFSEEAERLAERNGIALLNGDAICTLLLAELGKSVTQSLQSG